MKDKSSIPREGKDRNKAFFVTLGVAVFLALSCLLISCDSGSGGAKDGEPPAVSQGEDGARDPEKNARELGTLRVFVNRLEGELNEPVDAQIRGEVTRMAQEEKELWLLLKVSEFNVMGPKQGSLRAAPGSELCIRLRKREGEEAPSVGDRIEVNAMVSKSLEGPVIIGRMYRILGSS